MIRVLTADELKDLVGDRADAGFGAIDTAQGCLPLTALEVDVQIEGLAAETTVRQQFRNVFAEPLEATYVFPLPPRAAVTGFRMTVNDRVIEGRIDERSKARADYNTAIAEGRTASIAEQERADVFTMRVGNIPPQSIARIELTLVAPVAIDALEATYRFPLVVAPRYCPGTPIAGDPVGDGILADTDLVPDASRISPPVLLPGFKSPVQLRIHVQIAAGTMAAAPGHATRSVGCTLPATEARGVDGSLSVTVVPEQRLDRDFILRWGIAADAVATTTLLVEPDAVRPTGLGNGKPTEAAPGDGTFSLVIVPPAKSADVRQSPRDVVFVLDRSGSMDGWKMVAARRAVARMVDTLSPDDRLAIVAFDTVIKHYGDSLELAAATDRHRWSVLEWLGSVEARGGTELAAALEAGLDVLTAAKPTSTKKHSTSNRDRYVVLVTDGAVGDEDRVQASLTAKLGDATLFVVGICTAMNEGLLSRMADSSGGQVEMVESEDRLDEVMERIHQRLATPLVSGLEIQSAGLDIIPKSFVPAKLPNLVPGVPVVVRGRYRGKPSGSVCVEGSRPAGDRWREQAEATPVSTGSQGSLWARARLRHLEDLYAARNRDIDLQVLEKQMVELSTAFGVLCRFTAIVAIDPRYPDRKPGTAPLRRIVQPVETLSLIKCFSAHPSDRHGLKSPRASFQLHRKAPFAQVEDLAALRMTAAEILKNARPKSGALRDLRAARVRSLLEAVLILIGELRACGAASATTHSLAAAYKQLEALPKDRDALVAILELLGDIAEPAGVVARWWRAPAGHAPHTSSNPIASLKSKESR